MMDNKYKNRQLITRRTFCIGVGKIGLVFVLVGRMFYMQFLKKNEYKTLSDKNRIKTVLLSAPRGYILDQNGNKIVQNKTCFRLLLDKNISSHFNEELDFIIQLLELDADQQKEVKRRVKNTGRRIAGLVIDSMSWRQVSTIEERKSKIQSFFIDTGFKRNYLYSESAAHLVGYLGKPSKDSAGNIELAGEYFKVGKTGLEYFYEQNLRGEFGVRRIEVNAHGRYVRDLSKSMIVPGQDLKLNINMNIQAKAYEYLPPNGCSATMMDCDTGGMIIYTCTPSYDPNEFYKLSSRYWRSLMNNPYKPLIDKCSKSLYPPGSIFKIMVFLAALEDGIGQNTKIFCTGRPELGGNSFRCARRSGHGSLNMRQAIKSSCNSYVYALARKIGPGKIINMAKRFGFGQLTGIDLPGEKPGFLPSPEWKKKKYKQKWTLGDTLNLSIGQGFMIVTPLQITRMVAAVANGGKLLTPQIVQQEVKFTQIDIDLKHLDFMRHAMHDVINKPGGTGYWSKINHNGQTMAAKTGTAQVMAKKNAGDDLNRLTINWNNRNHAIFTGFAPFKSPKYALTIYYDHGGGGGSKAAPIAKKIMLDSLRADQKFTPNI
ncbi:MAG: hypothetical protein DGJ47_000941 [Rickettsiaceae bacterium]